MSIEALASGWGKALGGDRKQFDMFFNRMLDGFAYHKIVVDKAGKPVDYVFLEINQAFEEMTGLKRERIIGKKVTSVLSGIEKDPSDWIGVYGRVALTGEPIQFENYNEALHKWFKVVAYSPEKDYFVALFEDISKRRKAEEELSAGEERYRHLVQYAPTAIYEIDFVNQRFKSVNDAMCIMSGYNRAELLSMNPLANLAPESQIRFKQRIGKALAGEKIDENVEYKVVAKNGREFWVTLNMKLLGKEGQFYGAQVVAHDITERKKAEEALKHSEEKYRQIVETTQEGILVTDLEGKITFANNHIAKFLGYTVEELISKSGLELIAESEKALALDRMEKRQKGINEQYEIWMRRKDGGKVCFLASGSPILNPEGQHTGNLGTYVDITEQKKAEAALREASEQTEFEKKRLETILETTPSAVVIVDASSGKFSYANKRALQLYGFDTLGLDLDEHVAKVKAKRMDGTDYPLEEMPVSLSLKLGQEVHDKEMILSRPDGQYFPVTVSAAPLRDAKGNITAAIAVFEDITQRKQAEEAMRKQASLIDLSPDAIIVKKLDDTITFWSQGAQSLYGWTKEEALEKKSRSLLKTKFPEPYDVIVRALLSDGRWSGEKIHQDKFGHEIIVESRWLASCSKREEIEEILETNVDITERKKAQEALGQNAELARQRAEELEKLMDIIPAAVWVSRDPQCENITGNQAANKFYEAHGGENVSAGPADGGDQNSTRRFFQGNKELTPQELPMQEAAAKNVEIRNSELDVLLPSNRKITILGNVKPLLDNKGEVRGCLAVFMDVTERKQAEDALKENEQLYRTVFDNSQDGFQLIELIYDENGKPIDHKFLKVNHAYEKIIGVKAKDILDKTAKYISPNQEPHWLEVPDRVAKTGISEHVELYNKDIDKTLDCYYFLYSKNVIGTLFRDITERKNLEKKLQDSERLAAIGATAGMVGHDIRNPLQAITSDVFLAKAELTSIPDSEEKKNALESLGEIEKNTDYINKIVQDLQDYARPLNPTPEESDLKLIIAKLCEKNSWPDNIELSIKIENKAGKIRADSYFINRIMYNLVTNAVQAMPNGGKLTIHVFQDPKNIVMAVKDTGVGIPKNIQGKLFTPMFTTKAKGQGFGLPVVKRMTESLGGTVTFESEEGKGTTFTVRLPLDK